MLDAKIASALNKFILKIPTSRKVSLEEHQYQKKDRFLRGRQVAFIIYDYFRFTGAHDTVLDDADLFSITVETTTFRNSMRDGMKFYYQCRRFHRMIFWKVCTN